MNEYITQFFAETITKVAVVFSVIIAGAMFIWFLNSKHKDSISKIAAPPTSQLIFFNAGPCQYIMVRESNALAIAHQGNCTNHQAKP